MSFLDQVLQHLEERKEAEAYHRKINPPPADKFMNSIRGKYKSAGGYSMRKWKDSNLWFTFSQDWKTDEYGKYGVLLRNVYVFKKARGKRLFHSFLKEMVALSEETGCMIFAVCSPFKVIENGNTETYNLNQGNFVSLEYPDYEIRQKQMRGLFTGFGFSPVGSLQGVGDTTNIDIEDHVFYKPRKHNTKFVRKYMERDNGKNTT
jgi:hypothetical protein